MNRKANNPNRFQRRAVQVDEAQARIMKHAVMGSIEHIDLADAFNRRLAIDVSATHAYPHFRRSGMDGYAIRTADIQTATSKAPVQLQVIEQLACGSVPKKQITAGKAARIMTGAMVPDGADAVIMLEMTTEVDSVQIEIKRVIQPGTNLSEIGSELAQGTALLEKGRQLQAGEIALLATYGYATIPVYKRPRVAIIATGSELLNVNEPLEPGKIRNSNAYMLSALVEQAGGDPYFAGSIPDDVDIARAILSNSLRDADMVITSGGVSVGDYDILVDVFADWEGEILFNKVTMRPGSPTTVGVLDRKFLFALSGNPGACFVGFELFVKSVLWKYQGQVDCSLPTFTAFLGTPFDKVNNFTRFIRGHYEIRDGICHATPIGMDKSGIVATIKDANCLIVIPAGNKGLEVGTLLSIIRLE